VGSLDIVGFDMIWRMAVVLLPATIALLAFSRDLQLLAVDEDTAASLGVNVRRTEGAVYFSAQCSWASRWRWEALSVSSD